MRKYILGIIVLFNLVFTGCIGIVSSSSNLILDSDSIDLVVFDTVTAPSPNLQVGDKDKVKKIVELLKRIKVKELLEEEERELFSNPEVYIERTDYIIALGTTKADSIIPAGLVTLLKDGSLIFSDPKTVGPFEDGKVQRTVSYISQEAQTEITKEILEIANLTK